MKNPIAVVVGGPVVRGPMVGLSIFVALGLCGCTETRALKGGRAFTGRTTGSAMSQVLLQGENPSAPSRQGQEAAGDQSGIGRQICWKAAKLFPSRFLQVNFTSKKQDMGFALMNQLSLAQKRIPRAEQDIGADYFALRKNYVGQRWVFTESRNLYNPASHCDIAWAGALASEAHFARNTGIGARVG